MSLTAINQVVSASGIAEASVTALTADRLPSVADSGACLENPPLLVFSDDWGRHPSSCQHLIRGLLAEHSVHWVNTIGTRTPKLNLATARRAIGKFRQWIDPKARSKQADVPKNLQILNPRMWPWFTSSFDRRLNCSLLVAQLTKKLRSLPEAPIAITTLPITADLMGRLAVKKWIYYCVDDFSQWPGLDQSTMQSLERDVVQRADAIVAVSETLQSRIRGMGRTADLLTHGVDLEFWNTPAQMSCCERLANLDRPLVVFWGLIDRRMDLDFLRELSSQLQRGSIVLAGPEADPDPAIREIPRVCQLGALPYNQLPGLAREAAALIMPYGDLPVTRAMQPLKLKEYMAAGLPVIVRNLPSNREWSDCLDLAATPKEFAAAVLRRIQSGVTAEQQSARARLGGESWSAKSRLFHEFILNASRRVADR